MSLDSIEQMIIGRMIYVNRDIDTAMQAIKPEHFSQQLHQDIFRKIIELHEKNISVNTISLENFTKTREQFKADPEEAIEYLKKIVAKSHGLFDINSGIKILLKKNNIKKIKEAYDSTINLLEEDDEEDKFFQHLSKIEDVIDTIKTKNKEHAFPVDILFCDAMEFIKEQRLKDPNSITGLNTGFDNINKKIDGLKNGELIIIASRPSMGKTSLATSMLIESALDLYDKNKEEPEKKKKVMFFSLEMSAIQILLRAVSSSSNVIINRILKKYSGEQETKDFFSELKRICSLPIIINENPQLDIDEIRSIIRTEVKKNSLSIVFIDYLQLIKDPKQKDRLSEITAITRKLKIIAREFEIPVVVLSQLSRMTEQRIDKKPMLSDLRDSGSIEQDADIVMLLYREEYYLERVRPEENQKGYVEWREKYDNAKGKAHIIVAKNRNGAVGELNLFFNASTTKFSEKQI